jgi:hypothetical protein
MTAVQDKLAASLNALNAVAKDDYVTKALREAATVCGERLIVKGDKSLPVGLGSDSTHVRGDRAIPDVTSPAQYLIVLASRYLIAPPRPT